MIRGVFIGQERVVDLVLITLLCGGHGVLVGLPGVGKTRLVEALSTVMGLRGNRVQFTPDLMPADILGSEVSGDRIRRRAAISLYRRARILPIVDG